MSKAVITIQQESDGDNIHLTLEADPPFGSDKDYETHNLAVFAMVRIQQKLGFKTVGKERITRADGTVVEVDPIKPKKIKWWNLYRHWVNRHEE